jgi:hypothetical protein
MTKGELVSLERDVEEARARFEHTLARVHSPAAFEELKEDLLEVKDEVVDRARDAAQETVSNVIADLKGRAAANPLAVAAIGAGLLWRFVRRPPVASVLVGLGAISLFKTSPNQNPMHERGRQAFEEAVEYGRGRMQTAAEGARTVAREAVSQASEAVSHASETAREFADRGYARAEELAANQTARDNLLLGVAAVAVGAAMLVSFQKEEE